VQPLIWGVTVLLTVESSVADYSCMDMMQEMECARMPNLC